MGFEKIMEDAIISDPQKYIDEKGLKFIGRQFHVGRYIFDLLFEDRHGGKLLVELQAGTLDRDHTYKILDYYHEYKDAHPDEFIDLMVIANTIPPERKKRLSDMVIAFKEIQRADFISEPQKSQEPILLQPKSEERIEDQKPSHPKPDKLKLPDNLRGRSIRKKVIPTVCNLKNMLLKLKELQGQFSLLKQWEKRSYKAYQIDKVKDKILSSQNEEWKEIVRNHILNEDPLKFGASCIDIYLVAYVAETFGPGRERFLKYVKENGISPTEGSAKAIWQVGKGDGVFLDILHNDGTIRDVEFIKKWANVTGRNPSGSS